jgi:hypothetical protein
MDTPRQLNLFEWSRRAVAAPSKPQAAPVMPDMDTLQRALAAVRQELHNLQVMQMRPNRTPEELAFLHQLERSCRAEIKLRRQAIEYRKACG